ncbi:acyl-CoA N-acyltransferase [Dendryphion nanum]|uniref:Acyl-CoA N-acyltransferase n=1 Tax=Dendryphion nanum TaxID=256645 RepID=A0A9P9D6U6_9PLEO|nr:acyl-CoA N-acyltransferase [Dendryphion nanum]
MHIRPLTRSDLPTVGTLAFEIFRRDELYQYLYPHHSQFPDDLRRHQLIRLRHRMAEVGSHGFVTVTDETDTDWTGKSEILAFAFFIRTGDDEGGRKWRGDSVGKKLERYLLSWEAFYEEKLLNRAASLPRLTAFRKSLQPAYHSLLDPRWHLGILAVSPQHQRRGIGSQLLHKLQDLATQEEVPITLEASVSGRGLYLKEGFRVVEQSVIVEGLDGIAMVWEPKMWRGREGEGLLEGCDGEAFVEV